GAALRRAVARPVEAAAHGPRRRAGMGDAGVRAVEMDVMAAAVEVQMIDMQVSVMVAPTGVYAVGAVAEAQEEGGDGEEQTDEEADEEEGG
ncbi:MAG TPA: hypothetical protein VHL09_02585, partial [Dehalococcoidia bacterium]|nr:hypothetical protein [Dehalococcoidia bacterium]